MPKLPGIMKPILFLDIDGVLNSTESILRNKTNQTFIPEAISALNEIVDATDCAVVLSSTWREPVQWAKLPSIFERNGLTGVYQRIIGRTPLFDPSDGATREDEIDAWLHHHEAQANTPIAILDDESFEGQLRKYLVRTETDRGLTRSQVAPAVALLQTPRKG